MTDIPHPTPASPAIPPELEVAIFRRFWIWLISLSAIILALGGVVWALSVHQLEEYAKNISQNKTSEEFTRIAAGISEEMQRIRTQLSETSSGASKALGDSREQIGAATEIAKSSRKLADDVESELKRLHDAVKSTGEIFAAKGELDKAIAAAVKTPEFQTQFGVRLDAFERRFNEALRKTADDLKLLVGAPVTSRTFDASEFWTSAPDTSVAYTCPGKQVLAGMNFIMRGQNGVRTPVRIEYICKTLGP